MEMEISGFRENHRFCLKTWPWPWKYYFWGSQKRNWRVVKMFVWMYVCMLKKRLLEPKMVPWRSISSACMGKSKHTWKIRLFLKRHWSMYVCMYGPFWSYFLALHGQTYIHTYIQTFIYFFDVFLRFLPKNVALAMEMEISGFPKKRRFSHFDGQGHVFWPKWYRKTQLTSCKDVCLDVCMYVWGPPPGA